MSAESEGEVGSCDWVGVAGGDMDRGKAMQFIIRAIRSSVERIKVDAKMRSFAKLRKRFTAGYSAGAHHLWLINNSIAAIDHKPAHCALSRR